MRNSSAFQPALGTFMSLPAPADDTGAPDVAIVGVGFDVGTHPSRIGARQGPDHIRQQSGLVRAHLADRGSMSLDGIVDCGNVRLRPGRIESLVEDGTAALAEVVASGARPLGLGGDGTATFPLLHALHAVHGPLAVVHFDAHTDAYPCTEEERLNTATTFTCAVDDGLIDPTRSIHVGVRGTTYQPDVCEYARQRGFAVYTTDELLAHTPQALASALTQHTQGGPTYLCWDMDVFDPATAPGVATPEWGGLSAREGINYIRALEPLNLVGADVGTVSPPHDIGNMTGLLAARVTLEILYTLRATRSTTPEVS